MSVLFNNQFGSEQEENSYQNRRQHVARKVGQKDKRASGNKEDNLLVFGYACNVYSDDEKAVYLNEERHLIPWMGDESLLIDRFDGRLLLEDLSPFISKSSAEQSDSTCALSYEEQEMERLCDEERYRSLKNGNGSDDEFEEEEEMKRFKAAIASDSAGSYSAVGLAYDDQQYYSQYNYDATQMHGDMYTQYYPTYTEEQSTGQVALLQEQPATIVPFLQQHHEIQQQQLLQQQQQQQQEIQQQQQQPPPQEQEIEVFVPPKELNIPTDMEVVSLLKNRKLLCCCMLCVVYISSASVASASLTTSKLSEFKAHEMKMAIS